MSYEYIECRVQIQVRYDGPWIIRRMQGQDRDGVRYEVENM